jgi:hypothetical protein
VLIIIEALFRVSGAQPFLDNFQTEVYHNFFGSYDFGASTLPELQVQNKFKVLQSV